MKPSPHKYLALLVFGAALLSLETGCKVWDSITVTSRFSESAYQTAKSVKGKSLALIDKARGRAAYAGFAKDDTALMQQFDSAIAAEQKRPKNQPTVEQWRTTKAQMRRFLDLWKKKEKLSPTYVGDEKKQAEKTFDKLLQTEQEKRHS